MKKLLAGIMTTAVMVALMGCTPKAKIEINSEADLADKKIGCQAGTTGEIYIQENLPNAQYKSFKTGIDAALDLKNRAIDAVVLDELPAKEIVRRNPDLMIADVQFATEEYAIAVRKGDSALLSSINKTIAAIKSDGTYEKMINAYMPVDGNISTLSVSGGASSSDIVKMGTNAAFPPFEYTLGTKVEGFDIYMSELIARDYGKKLQVVDMNFDGLIAALQSGAIDFIAAGMSATDERRKNVDFSEPYYTSNQVIIIRK